jgi:hypothetical protein
MNPREMYVSHHWTKDRKDREEQINYVLNDNWGVTVCKGWDEEHNNWQYITSTGLLIAMSTDESFIATMYIPRVSQFFKVFRSAGVVPSMELRILAYRNAERAKEWEIKKFQKIA